MLKMSKHQWLRNSIQFLVLLWLLISPYINLFRMDITYHEFLFLGKRYPFTNVLLFFFAFMGVAAILVLLSIFLGRIICGWICPYNSTQEFLTRVFLLKPGKIWKRVLYYFIVVLLSVIVATSLEIYFINPYFLWYVISTGQFRMESILLIFLFIGFMLLYFRLRHSFCKGYCPYAALEMLLSRSPVRVVFDVNHQDDCLDCEMCQKVCHMEIDPRDMEIEYCVDCGKCIDGCRSIVSSYHLNSLLSYKKINHAEYQKRKDEYFKNGKSGDFHE